MRNFGQFGEVQIFRPNLPKKNDYQENFENINIKIRISI